MQNETLTARHVEEAVNIDSVDVVKNLSPIGDIPATERQARPLTKLPPAEQPMAKKKLPPLFLIH